MLRQVICAGFGGQGALSIGKSIIEAGMAEGLNVTWAPSYGPEMRGGTANCSIVLSDKPIGSPTFEYPTGLIAMNLPSLLKFEDKVVPGGLILVNSSVTDQKVKRDDVQAYYIPCTDIATEIGNTKVANMIMVGAYIKATGAVKEETVEEMIKEMFSGSKAKLIPANLEALKRGMECIQ